MVFSPPLRTLPPGPFIAAILAGANQVLAQDTLKDSARAITSKPVQRAVVNIVLLTAGAISLFCLAAVASALFFQNFVPDQFVRTPVHLQYGSSSNPYGIAPLPVSLLKSQQDYDISVTLSLPRSPANIERGNFMISLYLLKSANGDAAHKLANGQTASDEHAVVFHSRRPALVPYVDPVVSLASRVIFVFYHMLVRSTQTCTMNIPLAERVAFARGSTIPAAAYVEVEAGQGIQIYSVVLTMTAKLRGLRWLMFHYRLPTYLAFTSLFWACEFLFMSVAWTALSSVLGSSVADGMKLERRGDHRDDDSDEDDDDDPDDSSDDAQSFHLGRQTPLKGEVEAKKEEDYERSLSEIPMAGTEADDEDEDGETQGDSSVGASHGEGSGTLRRRTSRHLHE